MNNDLDFLAPWYPPCGSVNIPAGEDLGDIGPPPPEARLIYSVFYGCGPLSESARRDFLASLPKLDKPAAPKKYAARDINKLVEQVRSGQPPKLPKGKREQHYHDPALPSLYIRLFDTGVASWVVQWKKLGRQKKQRLGDARVLDRLKAIDAAKDLLARVQLEQLDPQKAKRERMRANKVTFVTVTPLFLEQKIRKGELRPRTAKHWKEFSAGHYFQPLHSLPIDEITGEQIQTQVDRIALKSNSSAITCCTILSGFFKWAIKTRKLPEGHHNPMINVQWPKKNTARERVLTDDEIRAIWKACEAWEAEVIYAQQIKASTGKWPRKGQPSTTDIPRAVMLLFLTGCRAQEIGDLQHSEIDLDNGELFIPKERIKTDNNLCNPLADGAVQILRRVERRPDKANVFGHTKRPGMDLKPARKNINDRIAKAGGTPPKDWTLHDIRRTVRTRLAALGVGMDVGERLLGHIGHVNPIVRTYNLHEYWPEKRKALAMWEANLRAIIDGTAEKIARPNFSQRREGNPA
jgi:integrase